MDGRRACVVGTGDAAARRRRDLERAGAEVHTTGPGWRTEDFAGCRVVVVCVDDWAGPADAARAAGALVYVPDVPEASDLVMAAIVRRAGLQIAVSTGGRSPAAARRLAERLDEWLPETAAPTLEAMASVREELRATGQSLPPYDTWALAMDAGFAAADPISARSEVLRVLGQPR